MKKNILITILLPLIGCSTSNLEKVFEQGTFKVRDFDNKLLGGFNIVTLEDVKTGDIKFLLSFRLGTGVDKPPFEHYDLIEKNKIYKLKLIPQDTLYIIRDNAFHFDRVNYEYFLEDILFIRNDTIKAKVFRSEDVFDKFVKLK